MTSPPSNGSERFALAPGVELFPDPRGGLLLRADPDAFYRLTGDEATLELIQAIANGQLDRAAAHHRVLRAGNSGSAEPVETPLNALLEAGLFVPWHEQPSRRPLRVGLLDVNPLSEAVGTVLRQAGLNVVVAEGVTTAIDLLLSCRGWLPDAEWSALDADCVRRGCAWQMAYAEGEWWHIGPLVVPGQTARYRDVRLRRLAAADHPDELRLYWEWLATARPPERWPLPDGLAVLAGLIAHDIVRLACGESVPSVQRSVRLRDLTIEVHPVLPLPFDPISDRESGV